MRGGVFRPRFIPPPGQVFPLGSAVPTIHADLAIGEAGDALSATSAVLIAGRLSAAEAADTIAATGVLPLTGSLSQIEARDDPASAGILPLAAAAAPTEANDTSAAAGAIDLAASAAITESDDTLAAASSAPVRARLSITEDDDTVLSSFWPVLRFRPRGGPWPVHDGEPGWSRRDWERDLRRIIDEAWRIANGEIDPVTRNELPPPDLSAVHDALAALADKRAGEHVSRVVADRERRAEEEAVALLLLAA